MQINSLGKFTLTHQRVFAKTTNYFSNKITKDDTKIIQILDELDENLIYKTFFDDGKKKLRAAEFFDKHYAKNPLEHHVRQYIDERLNKALLLLSGKTVYKMGNDNNPTSRAIKVCETKATVLFHFRRDKDGTRYFPTIKHEDQRIEFMYTGASIISNYPAWMLIEDKLLSFEKNIDGKKLLPFLNKRYIQISRSGEEDYFNKFVTHLVEKYDVYAEGFKIVTEKQHATAYIKIQAFENSERLSLKLLFKYGNAQFEYDSPNDVSAVVEKDGDSYTFKRIKRNRKWELEKHQELEKLGLEKLNGAVFTLHTPSVYGNDNQLIPIESTNKYAFFEWLTQYNDVLKNQGIEIEQSDEIARYFIGALEIKLEVKEQQDWFDVKAMVRFGEYTFPFLALKSNILSGKREFILPNGLVAIIPEEWFGKLGGMLELSRSDDEIKLDKHHIGLIQEIINDGGKYLRISEKLVKLKSYGQVKEFETPVSFTGELRPYQKAGFDWFYFLKENGFGGCLADDMGLGKTIQTLVLLQKEKEIYQQCKTLDIVARSGTVSNQFGDSKLTQLDLFDTQTMVQPETKEDNGLNEQHSSSDIPESLRTFIRTSLIVVPNSLVYNWYSEAKKFTPDLRVLVYTGINRIKDPQLFQMYDLVISTYGTVRVDIDILSTYKFNYVILDESQSIKNPNSLSSRAVKTLKASNRLVLTGTPIENSVQELWSQLSFINPGLLGSLSSFTERFVTPIEKNKDAQKLNQLKAIIKPFVLRRTKDQVAKELPPKIEQVKYCNMTDEQAEEYEKVKSYYRNEIIKSIQDVGLNKSQFTILQGLTKLRQIANHPKLTNEEYTGQAGKFDEIIAMAETAKSEGHKVLIFSQFVKQLEIYRSHFEKEGYKYCYLDGSTPNDMRQKQVNLYQNDASIPFFLISLKAGGVGLNLTAADYVFIIDPWWNPAVEQQAVDRTHRIGQNKTVFTYKFITKDSVEEKILTLQNKKKELAGSIITNEESYIKTIDVDEILDILS